MGEFKRTLVTAALPYTNGPVHIGHLSGAYLPADIYVRYLKAKKKEVLFVCGSDEHGVAITIKAKKEGLTPQQLVDKYHTIIRDSFAEMNIEFDIYHRTSDPIHHETASAFFEKFYNEGKLIEKSSLQFFDNQANMFLADRYITGTCPKCHYEKAYGDQCEKCGSTLSPSELIQPKSALSQATPIMKETKHWYLPLDKYQERIEKYISEHPDWKTNVLGQCKSWLKDGLQPRAITRDLDWGIPVPVPNAEGKVLYVWFDAPIGYISATKAWAIQQGKPEDWKIWWQKSDSRLIHFIGKDNIVFHCIIFPSMLMEHGEYIVPDNVPANEFLNLEGDKISTSRNWAVWVHEYLQDFPKKADILRYVLCATLPETKDNDFTWKDFQTRHDSELADILGNFLNRVMVMTHKNFDGKVQALEYLTEIDQKALKEAREAVKAIEQSIESFRFRDALFEVMRIARIGNKYLMETEPWKVLKTEPKRTGTILSVGAHISAMLAIAIAPFMPETSAQIAQQLNLEIPIWDALYDEVLLPEGHSLGESFILFQKIPDEVISYQIEKLKTTQKQTQALIPSKTEIEYPDFEKLDLRIGTILEAKSVPKANKLLQLTVDVGLDTRTIVSGIAEHFKPEELVGKQVCVVINLKSRMLRGIASQGMILTAETPEGKLVLVHPAQLVASGSIVK